MSVVNLRKCVECLWQHFLLMEELSSLPQLRLTFSETELVSHERNAQIYLGRMQAIARQHSRTRWISVSLSFCLTLSVCFSVCLSFCFSLFLCLFLSFSVCFLSLFISFFLYLCVSVYFPVFVLHALTNNYYFDTQGQGCHSWWKTDTCNLIRHYLTGATLQIPVIPN